MTRTTFAALAVMVGVALFAALVSFAGGATAGVEEPTPTPTPIPAEVPEGCVDASPGDGTVEFDCVQEAGVLRLHLGQADYVRYEPDSDGDGVIDSEQSDPPTAPSVDQSLNTTGCALSLGAPDLVTLDAGPAGAELGQKKNSIGVRFNEGGGEPCAQANGADQTLTLSLGTASEVAGKLIDWAEIDIERKFDAVVRAEFFADGANGEPVLVGTLILGCDDELSDCGPDSTDGDNFRLDTRNPPDGQDSPDPFDTIVLSNDITGPSNGAFSLEGGSDGTAPGPYGATLTIDPNDSLFHLVTIETLEYGGTLDCTDVDTVPVPSGSAATSSSVERLQNKAGDCILLPYNLTATYEIDTDTQTVFFDVDTLGQAARFLWTGTWDIEDAVYPTEGVTKIDYLDGNGPQNLMWCGGTYNPSGADSEARLADVEPIEGVGGCLVTQQVIVTEQTIDDEVVDGLQVTEMVLLSDDPRMLR